MYKCINVKNIKTYKDKYKYNFDGPMAPWREGSSALVVVLIAYRHGYKGLPGSRLP
jgi:hypothetical protein